MHIIVVQTNRSQGNQYDLPELTRNNFLIGHLNENSSHIEYPTMI